MLTRRVCAAGISLLALLLLIDIPPARAAGGGGVTCPPGQVWDPKIATCVISVVVPPSPPRSPKPPSGPGPTQPPERPGGPAKCVSKFSGKEVPCKGGPYDGWWSNDLSCYVSAQQPQPPKSDPIWQGHSDGAVYWCYNPDIIGTPASPLWSANPPAGPVAPPDPRQLAQQATAAMQLKGVTVGIVPKNQPGSVGLVGMPQWMWVANPAANTWGPITKSASAGGYTVTATGKVDHIIWDMGDGQQVVCKGQGTPYVPSYGKTKSPTCGHDSYTKQGTYTVTATSYWVITWAGVGQTGTIPIQVSNSTTIRIGEAQVLTQ